MKRESIFNCPNMYTKGLSAVYLKDLESIKNGLPYSEETRKIRNISGLYNHYINLIFSKDKRKLQIIKEDLTNLRYNENGSGERTYKSNEIDLLEDNFILMTNTIQMFESFAELNIENKNMLKITKDLVKQFFVSVNLLDIPKDYIAHKLYSHMSKYNIKTSGLLKSLHPYLNPDLIVKEEPEAEYHKRFDQEEKLNISCDNLFYLAAKHNDLETLIYLLEKKEIKSNDILHMSNFDFNKAELISRNIRNGKYFSIEDGLDDFDVDSIINLDTCVYLAFFNATKKIDFDYVNTARELFINKGFVFNEENETIIITRAFFDKGLNYFKDWNWNGCNYKAIKLLLIKNKLLYKPTIDELKQKNDITNEIKNVFYNKGKDLKEFLNNISDDNYIQCLYAWMLFTIQDKNFKKYKNNYLAQCYCSILDQEKEYYNEGVEFISEILKPLSYIKELTPEIFERNKIKILDLFKSTLIAELKMDENDKKEILDNVYYIKSINDEIVDKSIFKTIFIIDELVSEMLNQNIIGIKNTKKIRL